MRKILVISDSHGNHTMLLRIIEKELPFQCMIHCGDGAADFFHVDIPPDVRIIRVAGNVDSGRGFDIDRIVFSEIYGKKLMVTHGDEFRVRNGYDRILQRGKKNRVDVIFFGHTHLQYLKPGNPVLFNPGALTEGFYGIVTIDQSMEFFHRKQS